MAIRKTKTLSIRNIISQFTTSSRVRAAFMFIIGILLLVFVYVIVTNAYLNNRFVRSTAVRYPTGETAAGEPVQHELLAPNSKKVSTTGNYEVTTYRADILSRSIERDCARLHNLKRTLYVEFITWQLQGDDSCRAFFKVPKTHEQETLDLIRRFKPKQISVQTDSIAPVIESYKEKLSILNTELGVTEQTLTNTKAIYDELIQKAGDNENIEVLSRIINDKLSTIERLTQKQLDIQRQIEQYLYRRNKEIDRTSHTYFSVTIQNDEVVDTDRIVDAFRNALHGFMTVLINFVVHITFGIISFALRVTLYLLYALVALLLAKEAFRVARAVWKR